MIRNIQKSEAFVRAYEIVLFLRFLFGFPWHKISPFAHDIIFWKQLSYDPYNAKDFVERWARENGEYAIEKVIQGAKTESVPLGELKKLSEQRKLLFDEQLMQFAMGNCITLEDTNGNRTLLKQRYDQKIDAVAAMMDAYVVYKVNRDAFEWLLDYSFGAENLLDSSCWSFAKRISIAISVS